MDSVMHSLVWLDNTLLAICVFTLIAGIWLVTRSRRMGPWMRWPRGHSHSAYWRNWR
jgi:hypothetical protein